MGQSRRHRCAVPTCRNRWELGRIVNAYARLGTPSRWTVVGKICVDCGEFYFDQHWQRRSSAVKSRS